MNHCVLLLNQGKYSRNILNHGFLVPEPIKKDDSSLMTFDKPMPGLSGRSTHIESGTETHASGLFVHSSISIHIPIKHSVQVFEKPVLQGPQP